MTIERILRMKGSHVPPTVTPNARIADAIAALESEDAGALVVTTDGESIEGIISERDVVRGMKRFGADVLNHEVADLMTANVITCVADDYVTGVMALMVNETIRHVPVIDDGKLAGIISIHDIIKLRLDEVQAEADAMRAYISG